MADMIPVRWNKSVPAVPVVFKKAWQIYNEGEQAGFPAEVAHQLVEEKVALYLTPPPPLDLPDEREQAPGPKEMTREEELAALGVDTSTKEDSEEEMKRKGMRRPPKDKMLKGSQTK